MSRAAEPFEPPVRSRHLHGLDALRGIAATAVVVYHVARHIDRNTAAPLLIGLTQFGHSGVDLFFVLSGFVILFVHRGEIGRPAQASRYVLRRFSRVMPIYWVALAATLLLSAAGKHPWPAPAVIAWSALLLPSWTEPILGVAWTLQYELVFYAAFCVLILNRRAGLAVFVCWMVVILLAALHRLPWAAQVPPQLTSLYGVEFFIGMAVAWAVMRHGLPRPGLLLGAGALLFAGSAAFEDLRVLAGSSSWARLAYGTASALLIAGVVGCERSGRLRIVPWLRSLGESSYAIYLFQFVFIGLVWQAVLAAPILLGSSAWLCALLAISAVVGGIVISYRVERPMLRMLRKPCAVKNHRVSS